MAIFGKKSTPAKPQAVPRRRLADPLEPPRFDASQQYRRGITIAGSTQHRLQKSEPRAIQAATPREKTHRLIALRRRLSILLWICGGCALFFGILVQQFSAGVHINYASDNARLPDSNIYSQTIQQYFSQHPLERIRFYTNQAALQKFVIARHPEVATLTQDGFVGFGETAFTVSLRRPVASWRVKDVTYYVDATGVSFRYNAYSNPQVTVVDNSGANYQAGSAVASSRFLSFVGRAIAIARQSGITITEATIPPRSFRQVECTIKGKPYKILMSIDRSAGEQVEDMQRSMAFFASQNRTPAYIDIRVKGRAFFREP